MDKVIFTIVSNTEVAAKTFRLCLSCGFRPDIHSGEFVELGLSGRYLRRPFAVADINDEGLILCYKVVGEGTEQLSKMKKGETLELLLGLGNGFDTMACSRDALLVAGGLGAAPLYLLAKELVESGKKVSVVLGFNTARDVLLVDEYRELGIEPRVVTVDGSYGAKGFVSDYLSDICYDYFYTCGPLVMMKNVCKVVTSSGECSLEERMGCGAGFCYACTCHTMLGAKRVCKDGPVFKKEEIVWD